MKKFLYLFLFIFLINSNAYSASGDATEYKITIYKIELCETGSTVANCLNPVTLFEEIQVQLILLILQQVHKLQL